MTYCGERGRENLIREYGFIARQWRRGFAKDSGDAILSAIPEATRHHIESGYKPPPASSGVSPPCKELKMPRHSIVQPAQESFEEMTPAQTSELPRSARSPLRYPGGKSKAVKQILAHVPEGTDEIASPFLGGGSVELACAEKGIRVHGSDAFEPLINFWQQAKEQPVLLSERARAYHPLSKAKFYSLQKGFDALTDELEKAAVFFVLNRSSFSGTTLSGGMSPGHPRFTPSAVDRLRDFRAAGVRVEYADYRDALARHPDHFLYLDPPYANGEKLYGSRGDMHEGFSHEELADALRGRDGWILSYNDCDLIRKLYGGYSILTPEWGYGMSNGKESEELLIVNV